MKITKKTVDRGLTVLVAVSAPVLTLLIRHDVLSAADATDIGAIEAAAIGAYHTGAVVEKRKGSTAVAAAELAAANGPAEVPTTGPRHTFPPLPTPPQVSAAPPFEDPAVPAPGA